MSGYFKCLIYKITLKVHKFVVYNLVNFFFLLIFASVIIVMSLREIGERNVTEQQMNIIKCHLEKVPANDFQKDILLAPIWVRKKC